ncbi:MAG: hypothetical protein ACJAVK_002747 [Akkermansiaceae bacterium]|jgi:hypothetical protein
MKEVFRHHEYIRVNQFRDLVEAAGIPTMLRNEHLVHGVIEIPIPEFYPNLCVMSDDDYEEAWNIIKTVIEEEKDSPGDDLVCAHCGEKNPGNFGECFACQKPLTDSK